MYEQFQHWSWCSESTETLGGSKESWKHHITLQNWIEEKLFSEYWRKCPQKLFILEKQLLKFTLAGGKKELDRNQSFLARNKATKAGMLKSSRNMQKIYCIFLQAWLVAHFLQLSTNNCLWTCWYRPLIILLSFSGAKICFENV